MSACSLPGFYGIPEPSRPRPFEVGRILRVWFRSQPWPVGIEGPGAICSEASRRALREVGVYLTPWQPRELILSWGVVAVFPSGWRDMREWTTKAQKPPEWIGSAPPEGARLMALSGDERLVVERVGSLGGTDVHGQAS